MAEFVVITRESGQNGMPTLEQMSGRFPRFRHVAVFSFLNLALLGPEGSWDVTFGQLPIDPDDPGTHVSFSVASRREQSQFARIPERAIVMLEYRDKQPFEQLCARMGARVIEVIKAE